MPLGGVEMRVAGDNIAFLDEVGEQHILGCASLMGRNHIFETGKAGDDIAQLEKRTRAGIALIAHHQSRPLAIAHRARARVGKAVDVNLIGRKLKEIVVSLPYPTLAFLTGGFAYRLNHLDFPRFCKR